MLARPQNAGLIAFFVGLSALAAMPALAKAKHKKGATASEVARPETPAAEAPPPASPSPPPALAPSPGDKNRISYGPPGPGTGSVTIKGNNVQVTFDGRPFGVTPVTIHDVPKGDYIVEGTGADGREVARPVNVEENAEATVDLTMVATGAANRADADVADGRFRLPFASKLLLGVSAGGLAVGAVFGVLKLKAHHDYENATTQSAIDSYARTGSRDALIANVGLVTAGVALIAAGAVALPAYLRSERPRAVPTAVVAASGSHVVALAGLSMTF